MRKQLSSQTKVLGLQIWSMFSQLVASSGLHWPSTGKQLAATKGIAVRLRLRAKRAFFRCERSICILLGGTTATVRCALCHTADVGASAMYCAFDGPERPELHRQRCAYTKHQQIRPIHPLSAALSGGLGSFCYPHHTARACIVLDWFFVDALNFFSSLALQWGCSVA